MKVLIIRHGQSTNNLKVKSHFDGQTAPPDSVIEKLARAWRPDDELTSKGHRQAAALAARWGPMLTRFQASGRKVLVCSSFQNRAIQTAVPLARAIKSRVVIVRDVHEVTPTDRPMPGMRALTMAAGRLGRDRAMTTPAQILARNDPEGSGVVDITRLGPNKQTSILGEGGRFSTDADGGYGYPTDEQWASGTQRMPDNRFLHLCGERAFRIKAWLQSDEIQDEVGEDGLVVLFSHAAFISFLFAAALLEVPVIDGDYAPILRIGGFGRLPNTATTLLTVPRSSERKGAGQSTLVWFGDTSHLDETSWAARL